MGGGSKEKGAVVVAVALGVASGPMWPLVSVGVVASADGGSGEVESVVTLETPGTENTARVLAPLVLIAE